MTTATNAARNGQRDYDNQPLRVLVVDDEESLTDLLTLALEYEGWAVRSAGSGAEALRLVDEFAPHAMILDMGLPDFPGVEVVRRLRATASALPVLFLTARDDLDDRAAGLTAGAQGYLTKPFSLDEVIDGIRALTA
jgi:two-component system, OmpR family, response regulator